MDVVEIPKSDDRFRLLYDTKGRFVLHGIGAAETGYKLCRVVGSGTTTKAIQYITTHDGRTIRYPDPLIKKHDTVKLDLATGKVRVRAACCVCIPCTMTVACPGLTVQRVHSWFAFLFDLLLLILKFIALTNPHTTPSLQVLDFVKFEVGNLAMVTKGRNAGRIGVIAQRDRHPGSFDIVHIKDAEGTTFATRLANVFVVGKGSDTKTALVSLPKGKGIKRSIFQVRVNDLRLCAAVHVEIDSAGA